MKRPPLRVAPARRAGATHSLALSLALSTALILSACVSPLQWSSIPREVDELSAEAWYADFDALGVEMARHPKLAANADITGAFNDAMTETRRDMEAADPADRSLLADIAISGMQKALAAVGDGHTRLNASPSIIFPAILRFFPSENSPELADFESFSGWEARLVATDASHAAYLGKVVAKIGDTRIEDAVPLISEYLSIESVIRDGEASTLFAHAVRTEIMDSFTDPRLMRQIGFADGDSLSLTLEGVSEPISIDSASMSSGDWKTVLQNIPSGNLPFTRSRQGSPWWQALVPESSAPGQSGEILYFRYDNCDEEAWPTMEAVLDALPARESPASAPSRLIVDLRFNSGGDSRPGTRFANRLAGKKVSSTPGGVIVLSGGATFSSALMTMADILKACGASGTSTGNAIIVGEPLVEPLRHYGEVRRFKLPNSGIIVGRSSRLWSYDSRTGIQPARAVLEPATENRVIQTYEQYSEGTDAAFERALAIISQ